MLRTTPAAAGGEPIPAGLAAGEPPGGALTSAVRRRVALTIAGVDSGAGAGVVADLKTFEAHDLWGACAVTAVTAQNTLGVHATEAVSPEVVRVQIGAVASDLGVAAAKTGMLATAAVAEAVAESVRDFGIGPLVVDPVLVSSTGDHLLDAEGLDVLREQLLPLATVVTPNLAEAAALLGGGDVGDRAAMAEAAAALSGRGPAVVLLTGGHLAGDPTAPDCLVVAGEDPVWLEGHRVESAHTHGTGCVLSAALCAELARGMEPADACVAAKHFVERALGAGVPLGAGPGAVDPGWERRLAVPLRP
ncbi:MAG TPA: bifunctional hydroxymethylpyrimidine kinase/phosphomethylpyrimidine kinase [Acidimicrobiales bacterium]|nr:bifunctional hydroxymethylpyrimidine kinase/phosphomethylpyrimidine kinase [Acidimicrobiales bacterium]